MIKPIPSFPGYYATSEGKILSTKKGKDFVELSQRKDNWGYYQVNVWKDGKIYVKKVHKLIAEAFLPKPEDPTMQVDHKDGNKENNQPSNLEYVTPSENLKRAYSKGLRKKGDDNSQAKLTTELILSLVERANNGESVRALAKEVGVHENTLYNIFSGKKRKWMVEQGLIKYHGSYKGNFASRNRK